MLSCLRLKCGIIINFTRKQSKKKFLCRYKTSALDYMTDKPISLMKNKELE